ncbi:MAG: hypothetical protein V1690_02860 [Candidatus Moraniibacteriota bacterium]
MVKFDQQAVGLNKKIKKERGCKLFTKKARTAAEVLQILSDGKKGERPMNTQMFSTMMNTVEPISLKTIAANVPSK